MDSREQFEKWWLDSDSTSKEDLQEHEHIKGNYVHLPAQCAWEAWQASRATLVVELLPLRVVPEGADDIHCAEITGFNTAIACTRQELEELGITVS